MEDEEYRKKLLKNIQMLATLVATATYAAAFNPPGGVWQDIHDATRRHLPGDPIMLYTHYGRYVAFFYSNAAAFAFSLAVVVLTLLVNPKTSSLIKKSFLENLFSDRLFLVILTSLMLVAMLALAAAYGAGACHDKLTMAWYCSLVLVPLASFVNQIIVLIRLQDSGGSSKGGDQAAVIDKEKEDEVSKKQKEDEKKEKDFRKLMVPVSMFALTITYVAGLSTPGGFWDSAEGGHRPGDAILKDRLHGRTLRGFLLSNTLAFVASLYSVSIVMHKRTKVAGGFLARFNIIVVVLGLLVGVLVAYISASSRGRSIAIVWLTEAALVCIMLYVTACVIVTKAIKRWRDEKQKKQPGRDTLGIIPPPNTEGISVDGKPRKRRQPKAVQLMASLAVAITYQAGLYPPGGLWQTNTGGDMAGDPILLTTNYTRYRGFHYCNSLSFVASLLAMLFAQTEYMHEHHALEAAMLLDMLGLIGAYAIGSCRNQVSTLYVVGIAGAVVVYVFVHVSYFTLGEGDEDQVADGGNKEKDKSLEKMRSRFLVFAILVASITYQAGLTPPGGFLLKDDAQSGHHAGDPVLRYNYPRRYRAFFYCNSVSFMVSIAIILTLINPNEYKPALRSHAISVCSVASYVGLMGAFAAGSTQHMKGSLFIFVLAAVVNFFCCVVMPLWLWLRQKKDANNSASANASASASDSDRSNSNSNSNSNVNTGAGANNSAPSTGCSCISNRVTDSGVPLGKTDRKKEKSFFFFRLIEIVIDLLPSLREKKKEKSKEKEKEETTRSVYLVTLAILVASATYPTGLDPPGGSWQSSSGHDAGNPVMYDNRRPRYLVFFFSNTTSFMASIILIHMLLPAMLRQTKEIQKPSYRKGLEGLESSYRTEGLKGLVYVQCLGFLVAYAAGSSRRWKTSLYTGSALVIVMLAFFSMHILLSKWLHKKKENKQTAQQCPRPCNNCTMQPV